MPNLYQFQLKFTVTRHDKGNDVQPEAFDSQEEGFYSMELEESTNFIAALKRCLVHYVASKSAPQDVALFPHACSYFQLPNGYSVLAQTFVTDSVDKYKLNCFTHAYIFDSDDLFEYIDPFKYFKENKSSSGYDQSVQTEPHCLETINYNSKRLAESGISRQEQRDIILDLQKNNLTKSHKEVTRPKILFKTILDAFQEAEDKDDKPHVIVVTGEEEPLALLERTFALLPLGVAKRIEFITYSGNLDQEIRPCVGKTEDPGGVFKDLASKSDKDPECRNILVVFVPHDVFQVERKKYAPGATKRKPWQMWFLDYNEPEDVPTESSYYWENDAVSGCLGEFLEFFDLIYSSDCPRGEIPKRINEFPIERWAKFIKISKSEKDFQQHKDIFAAQGFETFKRIYRSFMKSKGDQVNLDNLDKEDNAQAPPESELQISPNIQAWLDCLPQDRLACLVQQALAHMCKLNEEQLKKWLPDFYEEKGNFTQIIVCICSYCCDKLIELLCESADSTPERQAVSDNSIFLLTQILFDKIYDKSSRVRGVIGPNKNFPKFIDYLNPELVCVFFWRVLKLAVSQDDPEKVLDKNEQAFILRELFHAWDKIKSDLTPPEEFISQLCNTLYDFWTKELYSLSSHPYSEMFAFWHGYFSKYHAKKDNFFADVFERQISDKLYFPNPNDQSNGINLAYNCGLTTYVLYLSGKTLQDALEYVKEECKNALNAFATIPDDSRMNFRNAKEITKKPETIDALAQYCRLVALADFLGKECGEPSAKAPNLTALGSQKIRSRN